MKDSFTYDEVKDALEKALNEAKFQINEKESDGAQALDTAWNRGASSMYFHALINLVDVMGVDK